MTQTQLEGTESDLTADAVIGAVQGASLRRACSWTVSPASGPWRVALPTMPSACCQGPCSRASRRSHSGRRTRPGPHRQTPPPRAAGASRMAATATVIGGIAPGADRSGPSSSLRRTSGHALSFFSDRDRHHAMPRARQPRTADQGLRPDLFRRCRTQRRRAATGRSHTGSTEPDWTGRTCSVRLAPMRFRRVC